jgi:hypothetical protein
MTNRDESTPTGYHELFSDDLGCGQIKSGAPARGERLAKYNRLLMIELELREAAHELARAESGQGSGPTPADALGLCRRRGGRIHSWQAMELASAKPNNG